MGVGTEQLSDKEKKMSELAKMVNGILESTTDPVIKGVGDLKDASDDQIAMVSSGKSSSFIASSSAAGFLINETMESFGRPAIRVKNPVLSFAILHQYFLKDHSFISAIHSTVSQGKNCRISEEIILGAGVILGDNVTLGKRVVLHPGVVVGDNVIIGDESEIHSNVTLYSGCQIGRRVILHSGAVIGADGFGYATDTETGLHVKRPHVGSVIIDDDVEIGANTCVDRGTFGVTHVGAGTKIDNLVQVGHNCIIGRNCIIVGQVGLGGSVCIGDNVVLAGKAAVKDHVTIGNGAIVAGKSGVNVDVEAGAVVAGMPVMPIGQWRKSTVGIKEIPNLIKEVRQLRKRVAQLEEVSSIGESDSEG